MEVHQQSCKHLPTARLSNTPLSLPVMAFHNQCSGNCTGCRPNGAEGRVSLDGRKRCVLASNKRMRTFLNLNNSCASFSQGLQALKHMGHAEAM